MQADHMIRRFPAKETQNSGLDSRRVLYLAYNLQQELLLESKYIQTLWAIHFLLEWSFEFM